MGLQGGAAFGGRHLGHGHGGHQVDRRRVPARVDRRRALHPGRHHPRHCHGTAHLPRLRPQQARTICATARCWASFCSSPTGSNSTGLTDTTASNSSFLTTLYCVIIPFLGWIIIRTAPDPLQHCGGYPVRHRRGLRGSYRAALGEFSLRFGDFITLAVGVSGSACTCCTRRSTRAGRVYDAAHGHSVHRGGPAGPHHRAYHSSPCPTFSQLGRRTLG